MESGYYTKRIKELEKRKEEVAGEYLSAKLSLKAINKEIENCLDYMNEATYGEEQNTSDLEHEILSLKNKNNEKKKKIKKLVEKVKEKNKIVFDLNRRIVQQEREIAYLKESLFGSIPNEQIEEYKKKEQEMLQEINYLKKNERELKAKINSLKEVKKIQDKTLEKKNIEIKNLNKRIFEKEHRKGGFIE